MDETSQIQPPPSFAALYADRHGRLKASIADVVGRYELCEDLASHLVEQAQTLYHSGNSSEQGVLLGMHAGLAADGVTTVRGLEFLDRGYADFEGKLNAVGASIVRLSDLD